MTIGVFLIIFGVIYGLGIFALVDALKNAVHVDDDGYPIQCKVIPISDYQHLRRAA